MAISSEGLAGVLAQYGSVCPICGQAKWGVVSEEATLEVTSDPEGLSLMRALCMGCGFLAWFQRDLPESLQEVQA